MKKSALTCLLSFAILALFSCGSEDASPSVSETSRSEQTVFEGSSEQTVFEGSSEQTVFAESTDTEESSTAPECTIHSWEIVSKTDATCTSTGLKTYKCEKCGETKTAIVDKLGHSWKEADCLYPTMCTRCGITEGDPKHSYNQIDSADATCTVDGYVKFKCSVCGDEHIETVTAKWHIWRDATCTQPKTCTVCGATEGSALGHTDGAVCSRCGTVLMSTGKYNAKRQVESMAEYTALSRQGFIQMLELLGYTTEEATYGVDNVYIDYNKNALENAKLYTDGDLSSSYEGLIFILEEVLYFTHDQAVYGADNCGADWREQAVKCAKHYLDVIPMSRDQLKNQLEYEKFTAEQIEYALNAVGY